MRTEKRIRIEQQQTNDIPKEFRIYTYKHTSVVVI